MADRAWVALGNPAKACFLSPEDVRYVEVVQVNPRLASPPPNYITFHVNIYLAGVATTMVFRCDTAGNVSTLLHDIGIRGAWMPPPLEEPR